MSRIQGALTEGRLMGKNEGKTEMAVNLLKMKISIDIIVEASGLTRDEIERLALTI
jgi:predicted transposase/invertase (TIGR01784 family)